MAAWVGTADAGSVRQHGGGRARARLIGGFWIGLYALGALAFGWPAAAYAPLTQAHGQVQVLGLAGLLILGVGSLLLPAFWRANLSHPKVIPIGGGLVGIGLLAQLVGQPLPPSSVRAALVLIAAILPIVGFGWAGSEIARLRVRRSEWPAAWEALLLIGAISLVTALALRGDVVAAVLQTGIRTRRRARRADRRPRPA